MQVEATQEEKNIFLDQHWRSKLQHSVHAALLRADTNFPYVKSTYDHLMRGMPQTSSYDRSADTAVLRRMRRVIETMNAFASLTQTQRSILRGHVPLDAQTRQMNGTEIAEHRVKLQREVWDYHPALAELQAERDAIALQITKAAQSSNLDREAIEIATAKRQDEAPAIVREMHAAGLHFDFDRNGRVRVFPSSAMSEHHRALLSTHGAEIGDVVRAEFVTAPG